MVGVANGCSSAEWVAKVAVAMGQPEVEMVVEVTVKGELETVAVAKGEEEMAVEAMTKEVVVEAMAVAAVKVKEVAAMTGEVEMAVEEAVVMASEEAVVTELEEQMGHNGRNRSSPADAETPHIAWPSAAPAVPPSNSSYRRTTAPRDKPAALRRRSCRRR